MIDFIEPYISIVFDNQTLNVSCSSEPHDYVYEHSGSIFIHDDETDNLVKIGHFKLSLLDILNAIDNGYSAYDVFDASQELTQFSSIYDDDSLELNEKIRDSLYEMKDVIVEHLNVLIINRLQLYADFRGKKLGGVIIKALIRRFRHGVAVVALKPYPLQFEYGMDTNERIDFDLDKFSKSETTARNKLTKYYQKLGFIKLNKTEMMVLNPNI